MASHPGGWASTQFYVGHHSTQFHRCDSEDVITNHKEPGYLDGYHDIKCNDLCAMQSAAEPQQCLSGHSVPQFSRGALRRHRRKLARIVIDHWLYKSRKRLLIMRLQRIQKKVLKSFYFRAWRSFATTCVKKRDKLKKALHFRALSIKKQTFYAWSALSKIELKREQIFEQIFKLVKAQKYRLILYAWHEHSLQHFQQRRLVLKAEQIRNLSLLSTCFMNWQIRVQDKQYVTYLRKLALGFWAHKRLSYAWQEMKRSVKIRHSALELMNKRRQRVMRSALQHWHQSTLEGEHDRKRKAALAQAHFENKLLRSAFNTWCQHTQAQIKKKEDDAATWFNNNLCSRCIQGWKKLLPYKETIGNPNDEIDFWNLQKQNLCKMLQDMEFLRSQNRLLLHHKCLCLDRMTWRRFLRRTGIKYIVVAQTQAFYKACFQKLKHSVCKDLRRLKKQERALNKRLSLCLQKVTTMMAISSKQESSHNSMRMITSPVGSSELKINSSEGQVFPRFVPHKREEQCCSSSNKETRATPLRGRIFKRFRLPPRRPPYLIDETDIHAESQRAHVANTAMQRKNSLFCPGILASTVLKQTTEVMPASIDGNVTKPKVWTDLLSCTFKCHNGNASANTLKSYLYEPDILREELLWTEGQLSTFNNLNEEIDQKIAELNKYKSDEQFKVNQAGNPENTIMVLPKRRALLLPIIQSLETRATELRELLSNKRNQALHLD